MHLVPRGSVSVDPDSHLRGASLAQSGMAGRHPCIPSSAYAIAAGIQDLTTSTTTCEIEQEDLNLEDNGSPGVHGARLHGPGQPQPFMVTRTGLQGGGQLAEAGAGNVKIGGQERQSGSGGCQRVHTPRRPGGERRA